MEYAKTLSAAEKRQLASRKARPSTRSQHACGWGEATRTQQAVTHLSADKTNSKTSRKNDEVIALDIQSLTMFPDLQSAAQITKTARRCRTLQVKTITTTCSTPSPTPTSAPRPSATVQTLTGNAPATNAAVPATTRLSSYSLPPPSQKAETTPRSTPKPPPRRPPRDYVLRMPTPVPPLPKLDLLQFTHLATPSSASRAHPHSTKKSHSTMQHHIMNAVMELPSPARERDVSVGDVSTEVSTSKSSARGSSSSAATSPSHAPEEYLESMSPPSPMPTGMMVFPSTPSDDGTEEARGHHRRNPLDCGERQQHKQAQYNNGAFFSGDTSGNYRYNTWYANRHFYENYGDEQQYNTYGLPDGGYAMGESFQFGEYSSSFAASGGAARGIVPFHSQNADINYPIESDEAFLYDPDGVTGSFAATPFPRPSDPRFQIETISSDSRWVVRVETEDALDACIESLEASISEEPWLCLDFEGEHLGRSGTLTLIQICSLRPQSPVFVIDVLLLGRVSVERTQALIENPNICKVVFDPRMDVDVLVHHYQVCPCNFLDLQVLDLSLRISKGHPATFWLGFHKVLQNVCDRLGDEDESVAYLINAAKTKSKVHKAMSKDPSYFTRRPLSKADFHYAANDVALLCVILKQHLKCMGDSWQDLFEQCKKVSNSRAYEVASKVDCSEMDKTDACRVPLNFQRAFACSKI
eukprot:GEMP01028104.1.p1 GENE.GEMP01028104.1~~GEMP01028104.1.p1  ORF type:complete len:707 (+),score=143.89 GEMP01028104.1:32-2122(+)